MRLRWTHPGNEKMMEQSIVVDRIEDKWLVVLWGEEEVVLPRAWFPETCGEGNTFQMSLRETAESSLLEKKVEGVLSRLQSETEDLENFEL